MAELSSNKSGEKYVANQSIVESDSTERNDRSRSGISGWNDFGGKLPLTVQQTVHDESYRSDNLSFKKKYYKITNSNPKNEQEKIIQLTNNFDSSQGIDPQFVETLKTKFQNMTGDDIVYTGFLYAPKNVEVRKRVIGKNGWSFYLTTSNADILFIWDDRQTNKFLFWSANRRNLIYAMNLINFRINKFNNEMNIGWK